MVHKADPVPPTPAAAIAHALVVTNATHAAQGAQVGVDDGAVASAAADPAHLVAATGQGLAAGAAAGSGAASVGQDAAAPHQAAAVTVVAAAGAAVHPTPAPAPDAASAVTSGHGATHGAAGGADGAGATNGNGSHGEGAAAVHAGTPGQPNQGNAATTADTIAAGAARAAETRHDPYGSNHSQASTDSTSPAASHGQAGATVTTEAHHDGFVPTGGLIVADLLAGPGALTIEDLMQAHHPVPTPAPEALSGPTSGGSAPDASEFVPAVIRTALDDLNPPASAG